MRLRLLVVVAFVGMAAVPVLLAYDSGVMPGPQQASAESTGPSTTSSVAVMKLAWPAGPLGLAAASGRIVFEQRDRDAGVAGIWYYDIASGQTHRLFGRKVTGKSSGFPAAADALVVWSSWAGKRDDGPPAIYALDSTSGRRWQVAAAGRDPAAAGQLVLWVEPSGGSRGSDVIRGVNALTDEEFAVTRVGRVNDLAGWGRWAAWISGSGSSREVWTGSLKKAARYRLAAKGTAVAIDRDRVVWTASVGRHSTALVSWDRRSRQASVLYRMTGAGSSLSVTSDYAVWVSTREATGAKVWVYDFGRREAYRVSDSDGRQASPIIVDDTVYWADDRNGHWELYSRSLQH